MIFKVYLYMLIIFSTNGNTTVCTKQQSFDKNLGGK